MRNPSSDEQRARRFVRAYRESYPSLTTEYVLERIKRLAEGNKPENVIDMFLETEP